MSPEMIVIQALEILTSQRDEEGRLPTRLINNYMTLKHALEYGDCQDWSIISLAKQTIGFDMRNDVDGGNF